MKSVIGCLIFLICLAKPVWAAESCVASPELRAVKSAELAKLEEEDQQDRKEQPEKIDWVKVKARDLDRRIKVAEIFAAGCFVGPQDYIRAALIFQHGETADHFYQAFIWANTALRLGDNSHKSFIAVAADRYLNAINRKQIFGTQFSQQTPGEWCLEPMEDSFPNEMRLAYLSMSRSAYAAFFLKLVGSVQKPEDIKTCVRDFGPTPRGSLPGFW